MNELELEMADLEKLSERLKRLSDSLAEQEEMQRQAIRESNGRFFAHWLRFRIKVLRQAGFLDKTILDDVLCEIGRALR